MFLRGKQTLARCKYLQEMRNPSKMRPLDFDKKHWLVAFLKLDDFRKLRITVLAPACETCLWLVYFELFEGTWCSLMKLLIFWDYTKVRSAHFLWCKNSLHEIVCCWCLGHIFKVVSPSCSFSPTLKRRRYPNIY